MFLHRLSLFALVAVASSGATSIRGGDELEAPVKNQFACTLSAFDEDTCKGSSDDDGDACVWCAYQTVGFCVSSDQSEAIEEAIPQISCDDDVEPGMKAVEAKLPPSFWECLANMDEDTCNSAADDSCSWCNTEAGFGLCVASEAAELVDGQSWVDCDGTQEKDEVNDPLDTSCLLAGMGSDDAESVCAGTTDQDGDACVWCNVAGVYGVCLNPDQADAAAQFLTCDSNPAVDTTIA